MVDHDPGTSARSLDRRAALRYLAGLGLGALASACSKAPARLSLPSTSTSSSTSSTSANSSSTGSSSSTGASPSSSTGSTGSSTVDPSTGPGGPSTTSGGPPPDSAPTSTPPTTQPACAITPQQPEGPNYLNLGLVRSDITEGRAGAPLTLRFTVVNALTCQPIVGAAVDVWHCDASGVFSGVSPAPPGAEQGSSNSSTTTTSPAVGTGTFLRGIVRTDGAGVATFQTIYPGWYTGRTTHIHVKVRLDQALMHTGQCYFDDALTDAVYQAAPYSGRPARDTRNSNDPIYRSGGAQSMLNVTAAPGAGYVATMTLAIAGAGGRDPRL